MYMYTVDLPVDVGRKKKGERRVSSKGQLGINIVVFGPADRSMRLCGLGCLGLGTAQGPTRACMLRVVMNARESIIIRFDSI